MNLRYVPVGSIWARARMIHEIVVLVILEAMFQKRLDREGSRRWAQSRQRAYADVPAAYALPALARVREVEARAIWASCRPSRECTVVVVSYPVSSSRDVTRY